MKHSFDLHLHTTNSDGEYNTKELIEMLKRENISVFSITDHDNINSFYEVKNENLDEMMYISGIEFSSIIEDKYRVHILGYNIEDGIDLIKEKTIYLRNLRQKRIYSIAENLKSRFDIDLDIKDLDTIIENTVNPGRPHIAKLMVKMGIVRNTAEAFENYLPEDISTINHNIDAKEAIELIHKANGKAYWAHPKKAENEYKFDMTVLLDKLVSYGLDGVEICNSLHNYQDCIRYQTIAEQYNLLTSGGSDFHGETTKANVEIGVIYNGDDNTYFTKADMTIFKDLKL